MQNCLVGKNRENWSKQFARINSFSWRHGISSLVLEMEKTRAKYISVSEDSLQIDLADGRIIIAPLMWHPRLWHGSPAERSNYQIIGDGEYIHWPELDEDLTVSGVLAGHRSAESAKSLKKWLDWRSRRSAAI